MICDGHWKESSLYQQLKVSHTHRRRGARKWMTESELGLKYNSARIASRIVAHKLSDPEVKKLQVRDHPDAPGDSDTRLFFESTHIQSTGVMLNHCSSHNLTTSV